MNQRRRTKIRAPREDGDYLVSPEFPLRDLVLANQSGYLKPPFNAISGLSLSDHHEWRTRGRSDMIAAALEFSESALTHSGVKQVSRNWSDSDPIFLAGHQPEFFHPGVWFKNFLLSKLGVKLGGRTVNLIIDNDISANRAITVPTGTIEHPRRESVHFDGIPNTTVSTVNSPSAHQALPYEMSVWEDPGVARAFPEQVKSIVRPLLKSELILDPVWRNLEKRISKEKKIGVCIAQARHQFEFEHEVQNLEVPLSKLCKQNVFRRFVGDIIHHSHEFQELYNRALKRFRKTNGIRSQTHPVPELVAIDGWIELPFWIWSTSSPWRGPLYVRLEGQEFVLSDLDTIRVSLHGKRLTDDLDAIEQSGIAIRPRALMTTMFARTFLSDVFVHGIGGAKYDELTDQIIREYYGINSPAFVTASSTHLLPFGLKRIEDSELASLRQELRGIRFHPENRFGDRVDADVRRLVDEKQNLLGRIPPHGRRRSWHHHLDSVNRQLSEHLSDEKNNIEEKILELNSQRQKRAILLSREFSFLLHPLQLISQLHEISDSALAKSV